MPLHQPIASATKEAQFARLLHGASLARWSRGLALLSMWLLAAAIVLALLMAPALGVLADRSIGAFVLLGGLATILGVLTVAVLLADACTQPLVEMADAVRALDHGDECNRKHDEEYDNLVVSQPPRRGPRMALLLELPGRSNARGGAIVNQSPDVQCRCKLTNPNVVGAYIDINIPSDDD
jgi:hypothetical protein